MIVKQNLFYLTVSILITSLLFVHVSAQTVDVINLASDIDWKLSIDGKGENLPVKVPYGGWNSDRQYRILDENKDVHDYVIYSRTIDIPADADGKIVKLHFGAVNFGAEIYIDGTKVNDHHSNFTAFESDITKFVTPGTSCRLDVKAYVLNHYKNSKGEYTMPTGFIYDNKLVKYPFGIARNVEMRIYPDVYISDVFIKPSVTTGRLSYDVWIVNGGKKEREVSLKSGLRSWNESQFEYPNLEKKTITIMPGKTVKVNITTKWDLGSDSYWWPNIPFREDYVAQLHLLDLELYDGKKRVFFDSKRFGFVEHAEGPYYYTINGVRVNLPSDASAVTQGCVYDGYSESEAYKYTDKKNGCHETWKKFMRLGIRANRTHQEPPTQNILNAADEVGFLLIPETAIRGSHYPQCNAPDNPYYKQHIQDMIRECRNHPSVARYSLSNELHAVPEYLDMALEVDDTRPYIFETNTHEKTTRVISENGHAYVMTHYVGYPKPAQGIYGLGEYAWSTDGINEFASQGKLMRMNDICYFSGWSWTNYWPNFLEGWSHDTYAWQQNNHADRENGIDGWESPLIKYVEKALHPYLICDADIEEKNRFSEDWPAVVPNFKPGSTQERIIYIFNDGLSEGDFILKWKTVWDSPDGKEIETGNKTMRIKPGFHVRHKLKLNIPFEGVEDSRRMYLVMSLENDGKILFEEEKLWYNVTTEEVINDVKFVGIDSLTKGNWCGIYGNEGYDIAGAERKLPGYISLSYDPESVWIREDHSEDDRALQKFVNDGNLGISRIAAAYSRYGNLAMTIDVGNQYRNVALYFMGWDYDFNQKIRVVHSGQTFNIDHFKDGKYLLLKIRGKVTLILGDERNSSLSGVFIDR